ncbi:MAG: hypothetical protein NTV07_01185 [Candidatus Omnitrophica bacterium]|nr:hypothetical protein [Candidatus Omnitrophota bacterium]
MVKILSICVVALFLASAVYAAVEAPAKAAAPAKADTVQYVGLKCPVCGYIMKATAEDLKNNPDWKIKCPKCKKVSLASVMAKNYAAQKTKADLKSAPVMTPSR